MMLCSGPIACDVTKSVGTDLPKDEDSTSSNPDKADTDGVSSYESSTTEAGADTVSSPASDSTDGGRNDGDTSEVVPNPVTLIDGFPLCRGLTEAPIGPILVNILPVPSHGSRNTLVGPTRVVVVESVDVPCVWSTIPFERVWQTPTWMPAGDFSITIREFSPAEPSNEDAQIGAVLYTSQTHTLRRIARAAEEKPAPTPLSRNGPVAGLKSPTCLSGNRSGGPDYRRITPPRARVIELLQSA